MAEKIQRNAPCPCGSGKKYKRCCAVKEHAIAAARIDRREGVQKSLGWINQTHKEQIDKWVEDIWLVGVQEVQRAQIVRADPLIRGIHDVNMLEFMVAEGTFKSEDGDVKPLQLILDAELGLNDEQKRYLSQLPERPLRLYQVSACTPGESYTLSSYPDAEEETVTIEDSTTSRMFDVGDIVGLRLLNSDTGWETSGAIYHIPEEYSEPLVKGLAEVNPDDYSKALALYWLELVAAHV